jgi:DNA-binding IclR family transcriptional regulator
MAKNVRLRPVPAVTRALPLARAVLEHSDFPRMVRPVLEDLSTRYSVTAVAAEVPDLDHIIVVSLASAPVQVRLHVDVGSRFPALISATGRCVAAFSRQPWSEIEKRFRRCRCSTRGALSPMRSAPSASAANSVARER